MPSARRQVSSVARPARPTVGEALREAGPGVDVHEHVGDAGARQAIVERAPERLDLGRRHGPRRRDGQARRLETDVRQLAGPCASRDDGGQLLEPRAPLDQMLREDRRHRQRQRSRPPQRLEGELGQEVVVEGPVAARAPYPHVAGPQALAQLGEGAQFVGGPVDPTLHDDERPPAARDEAQGRRRRQLALARGVGGPDQVERDE
jgi:hypothetical protein